MHDLSPVKYLSNAVRERFIKQDATNTALLLDALYTLNCTIGACYSVTQILEITAPIGISEKVIRAGLKNLVFRRGIERTAGRPRIVYYLPSPRQCRDWFMLYDASENSDILPLAAFESVHTYKEHLHAALVCRLTAVNRGAFRLVRQKMADRLRVTIATVRNYEKSLPIKVMGYVTSTEIFAGIYWDLPPVNRFDHREWLLIIRPDGQKRRYPLVRAIAAQAISEGCRVFRVRQHANWYEWTGDLSAYTPPEILAVL